MALLLVSALLALSLAKAKAGSYLVTAPEVIYRGSVYDISVDILNTTDVNIKVVMQSKAYNGTRRAYDIFPVNTVEGVFGKGHTGTLSIPVSTDLVCQGCQLHIRGSGGLQFERNLNVRLSNTVVAVMIQTDKAIYKPGTIVRYRAFAVYPDLRLYTGEFVVKIMDPNDNKIQVLTGLSSTTGVIEGSLELSQQPLFGDWSITVSLEETSDMTVQHFTVADYQLPRFEITVELPPYGLTYQSELTGTVKAKYTFGQPVKGMVELHVGPNRGPDGCGTMPKTTQMSFEIDGEATFSMPKEDMQRSVRLSEGTEVRVTAFVKEAATGVRLNGSSVITYHRNKYNIKFLDNTPTVFKPGMPYTAFVQVSSPDGLPPTRRNQVLSVYTHVDYRLSTADQSLYGTSIFTGSYPLPGKNVTLPSNGVLAIDIDIPNNATSINIKVTCFRRSASKKIEKTYSKSGNFLQLTLQDKNIKARSTANFNVKGTEPLGRLTYEILSRGSLAYSGVINGENRTSVDFPVSVSSAMAPTGHMLVYYTRGSNEIVADSLAFNVDGIFENEVSIAFSHNKSEPNKEVDLNVRADPGSTVNFLVVDQSVLLLKTGNDITPKKIGDAVSKFDAGQKPSDSEYALSNSAETVREVFEQTGLAVITDVDMYRPPPPRMQYGPRGGAMYDSGFAMEYRPMNAVGIMPTTTISTPNSQLMAVERVRAIFPEAWLWSSTTTSSNGNASVKTTVPDTITSWVASAFATNPTSGLGVAPTTAKLQVFRPFFVSLSYPNEVTRGEQVVIQATVFNYLTVDTEVVVTLKSASGLSIIEVAADGTETPTKGDIVRTLLVKTQEQGVVYYSVSATKLGVAEIEIEAQSSQAADAVRRTIIVKSEGAPVSFTDSVFIYNEKDSDAFQDTVLLSVPPVTVEDSVRAKVKVTGDLIGTSLDGLTSLLSLPTGCGEQSMVKFAPDLYIAQYLQATGQLTDYLRQSIISYLRAGYQRQLTYQRYDGSFSAFGNSDESGSTWLTAYVIGAFSKARDFIYVDPDMIIKAVDWLVDRQNRDGSFSEFGSVLDRNIQGTETGPGLTAHILVALMSSMDLTNPNSCKSGLRSDCSRHNKWTNATANAIKNLEQHVSLVEDQLSLAVVSYALSLADSPQATAAVKKLNGFSKTEGALMYWSQNSTVTSPSTPAMDYRGSTYLPLWRPPHVQARPVDIQITSFAVLTYTAQGNLAEGLPAVRWLTTQRNSLGGFVSSQDTSLALQALSAYATRSLRPESKLNVKVATEQDEVMSFEVDNENSLVLQTQEFQTVPMQVDVTAKGAGMALVEIDFNFYVTEDLATPSFDVSTVLLDDETDYFNLMVCTKWLWDRKTGMVVQEVSIPSGFEPEMDSLNDVAGMKRAERLGNRVTVYFDEVTKTSTCYSVMMSRVAKVARTQRNYVRTYDYYEPANQATVFYLPKKLRDATICDVSDGYCQ